MKILFTNSPLHFTHGHTFTQPDWQTLVLPMLAAIVGKEHHVELLDNTTSFFRSNQILARIRKFKPDIVGFSIIAARDLFNTLRVIREVRHMYPGLTLIAGGPGTATFEEVLLKNGIDAVVRGEGEETLKELIEIVSRKNKEYSTMEGISYRKNGSIYKNPDRMLLKNLDDSPIPALNLMPTRKSQWFRGRFTGSIETSRGCSFDCNFCAITAFWRKTFRQKSNERIIDELKLLTKNGRTHLYLADDNFGMNTKKHMELFERILQTGLDIRFFAQMRTDTVALHPEMMKLARRAGLYGVLIGFDTYEADTFHHVTKIGSADLNLKCAKVLRDNKIMIFGSHIYGLPPQKKPLEFSRTFWTGRKNSDLFRMPHFSLLPGTKIYGKMITQEMIEKKEESDDFRLLIRPQKRQKRFKRWYTIFNLMHIFLPDEIFKALFHPNMNVRKIKRYGYIGILRHYLYRFFRTLRICDI